MLASARLDEARRHARDLAPALGKLLDQQGWKARDLDAVFVSRGPGSYTGLRVGIVSAKTLAYATGCVLLGIDTFAAIALQAPAEAVRIDVLEDAHQGRVYVQSFKNDAETPWTATNALSIQRLDDWLTDRDVSAWITGPGVRAYSSRLSGKLCVVPANDWHPRAESLLALGLPRYLASEHDDPWTLEPLYLRPSAAEEQRKNQG